MNSEKNFAPRYFGGTKLTGYVSALNARTFDELVEEYLKNPVQKPITRAEFSKMSKPERGEAKEVPYLVAATFGESPSRRALDLASSCNLIVLDLDEESSLLAAKFVHDSSVLADALAPFGFAAYTTASSTPEKPRMRVVVNADNIPLERYADAVATLGQRMGLEKVTPESKCGVQAMFLPMAFHDGWDGVDAPFFAWKSGEAFSIDDLKAESGETLSAKDKAAEFDDFEYLSPRDSTCRLADVKSALGCLDADMGYPNWIKVAAALKHQFSPDHDEEAYRLFDSWSASGSKYDGSKETRAKWDSLKQTPQGRAPTTIGTIFKMAKSAGWKKPEEMNGMDSAIPDFGACLVHSRNLVTMDIPKRSVLLDRWLCEGDLGYIFAARGVGKTWMSMALLGAISQGRALGAWAAGEKQCKVLYVDGEMPLELTKERTISLGLENGDVTFLHHEAVFDSLGVGFNIAREDHRLGITRLIASKGFGVLVLDNLSALASGLDENKGDEYDPVKAWLLDLRRRKVTVIVIHHAGRNGLMRGHSKREDDCSWILELKNAKTDGDEGAKFITHFAKSSRNTGDSLPDLLWHITTKENKVLIQCEEAALDEFQQFVHHVSEGVESQKEIAELMGKPEGTISKWTKRAVEEGAIRKDRKRLLPLAKPKNADSLDATVLDEGW